MRNRFLGAMLGLAVSAGWAWGQAAPGIAGSSPSAALDSAIVVEETIGPPVPTSVTPSPRAVKAIDAVAENPAPFGPLGKSWDPTDFLLWSIKGSSLPPLATTSRGGPPVLGLSDTTVLFGGGTLDNEERAGARFTQGYAFDHEQTIGIEGTYFFLGTRTATFRSGGPQTAESPHLGRPFIDAVTGQEQVHLVTAPGQFYGALAVAESARMQGAELNAVANLWNTAHLQVDSLVGFRYLEVDEGLSFFEVRYTSDAAISAADQFDGHNRFYGGQVGLRGEFRKGAIFIDVLGKVAVGQTEEIVRIHGLTRITPWGQPQTMHDGGVLALPTNSGRFPNEAFAIAPEGTVRVGYLHKNRSYVYVGYNFLYLSDVARPGDQIDRTLNPGQIPGNSTGAFSGGPYRPQYTVHRSDFWAQGLIIGAEYRY